LNQTFNLSFGSKILALEAGCVNPKCKMKFCSINQMNFYPVKFSQPDEILELKF